MNFDWQNTYLSPKSSFSPQVIFESRVELETQHFLIRLFLTYGICVISIKGALFPLWCGMNWKALKRVRKLEFGGPFLAWGSALEGCLEGQSPGADRPCQHRGAVRTAHRRSPAEHSRLAIVWGGSFWGHPPTYRSDNLLSVLKVFQLTLKRHLYPIRHFQSTSLIL